MWRFVRSALRTADRFVQVQSSSARLNPLGNLLFSIKGSPIAGHTHALSTSSISNSTNFVSYAARQPIANKFSYPIRVALQRPLSAPHLPKPPMVPRGVHQVGLGTARNFSTARPVFQNIVENVPIATRALWEAEWKVKKSKAQEKKSKRKQMKSKDEQKRIPRLDASIVSSLPSISSVSDATTEFNKFFAPTTPFPFVEGATTTVTIPLYPTAERRPLPNHTSASTLLPLSEMRDIHEQHAVHQARVSTIFHRLDSADAWSKNVECETYGATFGVTALRLVFRGWTKEMVLEVLGEAGQGWCEFQEQQVRQLPSFGLPSTLSDVHSPSSLSFVMPTLDFSSNFASHREGMLSAPVSAPDVDWTPLPSRSVTPSTDHYSDDAYGSDGWSSDYGDHLESRSGSRQLGFSVDFVERNHLQGYDHLSSF